MEQLWSCKRNETVRKVKQRDERRIGSLVYTYVVVRDDLAPLKAALLGGLLLEAGGRHGDDCFYLVLTSCVERVVFDAQDAMSPLLELE